MAIKKNRRVVLVQEYEQSDAKTDESIIDIYDRFLTLLNDLSLVGKEYEREDLNTKFLRALPEYWDTQQRKNRKVQRMKVVALNAETHKDKEKIRERLRRRNMVEESDTDNSSDPDIDNDEDSEIDMDDLQVVEMAAMLVKGFRRMRFAKPQRRGGSNRIFSSDGKGKFRKNDEQYTKGRKFDKTKVTCYKCNKMGHLASEWPKSNGKALVTTNSNKDWMDSSGTDNDDECYALMAPHGEDASGTDKINIKYARLEKVLENEREVFKTWMTSGKKVYSFISDENWKECPGYNKFTDWNINKAINNTTHVKFVRTDENKVESVYEVGSTSENSDEKKAKPRVSDKRKKELLSGIYAHIRDQGDLYCFDAKMVLGRCHEDCSWKSIKNQQIKKAISIFPEGRRARAVLARDRAREAESEEVVEEVLVEEKVEKVFVEEKAEEETLVIIGDQVANPKALMDYSKPKINDNQSSIIRPAITANTFEIKLSTI
ncbi:hypothetical protein AgCh_012125 [Apium graveolens]